MRTSIYVITLLALLVSCNNNKSKKTIPDSFVTISINKESITDSLLFTDMFDSVAFIKLEKTDESLMSTIDRIEVTHDRIYVLSSFRDRAVFVFKRNGKFIFKINNVGRGPGEFIRPADFYVDEKNKNILIYSSYPARLIKYDYNGKFIDEKSIGLYCMGFTVLDDNLYIYTCGNKTRSREGESIEFEIIKTDMNGKILDKYLPYSSSNKGYLYCINYSPGGITNLYNKGKEALFSMLYCDTIYSVTQTKFSPKYFIDFNEYTLPASFIKKHIKDPMLSSKISDSHYANSLRHAMENNKILYFEFSRKNRKLIDRTYLVFYKKKDKELIVPKRFIDNMCFFEPDFISMYKNSIIGIKSPFFLMRYFKNETSKLNEKEREIRFQNPNFKKAQEFVNSLSEDDNPVVVLLKLKE